MKVSTKRAWINARGQRVQALRRGPWGLNTARHGTALYNTAQHRTVQHSSTVHTVLHDSTFMVRNCLPPLLQVFAGSPVLVPPSRSPLPAAPVCPQGVPPGSREGMVHRRRREDAEGVACVFDCRDAPPWGWSLWGWKAEVASCSPLYA